MQTKSSPQSRAPLQGDKINWGGGGVEKLDAMDLPLGSALREREVFMSMIK